MVSAWWVGVPPAEAVVECRGSRHRVRWEAGQVSACDHDDLEGERTLAALGGEACRCVEVLDAWERHVADERVLVLGSRGPADRIPPADRDEEEEYYPGPLSSGVGMSQGVFMYVASSGSPEEEVAPPPFPLEALLALEGGLGDRLVATVAAACLERPSARLHAALYGRVRAAAGDVEVSVGEPAFETGRVTLPYAWLLDVWARGLTTVLGRFILAASTADGRAFTLTAADGATIRIDVSGGAERAG